MKYYVYALSSEQIRRIYVGFSSDVSRRLNEHNSGHVFSTKGYRPWKLVYQEEVETRELARAGEKYLKSGAGKEYLKKILFEPGEYAMVAQW